MGGLLKSKQPKTQVTQLPAPQTIQAPSVTPTTPTQLIDINNPQVDSSATEDPNTFDNARRRARDYARRATALSLIIPLGGQSQATNTNGVRY